MSDSATALIGRLAGLLFFVALGAGIYALITRDNLQAARAQLTMVAQERDKLKNELIGTERTVLASSADLQSCSRELKAVKGHSSTQTTQGALPAKDKAL